MLQIKNLSFTASENGTEKHIVKNISFDVNDGETIVVTGPNGGGKSSLAKVIMGILPANGGKIYLDSEDLTEYDIDHRANAGIGFAFQQPSRFKGMTVKRLLSLAAGTELSRSQCCQMLSNVGLCTNDYLDREADGTLSGGEMKRLEIATVLAKPHKLCIVKQRIHLFGLTVCHKIKTFFLMILNDKIIIKTEDQIRHIHLFWMSGRYVFFLSSVII